MSVDFSQYLVHEEEPSKTDVPRHVARSGARISETVLGLPGDITKAGVHSLNWIAEKTKKHLGFGKPKTAEELKKITENLPTSEKIRQFGKEATEGYLEPRSEAEKTADEYFQIATTLALPGPKTVVAGKVLKGVGKAAGLAGLATGTKKGLTSLGVDEDLANAASFASLMIPGILKGRNVRSATGEMYKEAESLLPSNATVFAGRERIALKEMTSLLKKGTSTPSKSAALKTAKDLMKKSVSGTISVQELTAFKRDINELMKDPQLLRGSEKFLPKISHQVDTLLDKYGKQNPEWLKKYRTANEMYGGLAKAEKATKDLKEISKYIKNPFTAIALGLVPEIGVGKTIGGWISLTAAEKGYEVMHRIFKNPSLRKYYVNLIKSSTEGKKRLSLHYLKKLDEGMEKELPHIDWDQYSVESE